MALREEFIRSGNWLFRWRSYLPLVILALVLTQLPHFSYLGHEHAEDLLWESFCLVVGLAGLAIRVHVVGHAPRGTSGRNTQQQVADHLNTTGMYSILRHPLYLGNYLLWLGVVLFLHDWRLTLVVSLVFWLYYERIMFAEEAFLAERYGAQYTEWADRTPAFIPAPRLWRPPSLAFSARAALRGEYAGLFGLIAAMTLLEVAGDWFVDHRLEFDPVWIGLFGAGLVTHLVLRHLKRRTHLLDVTDR